MFRHVYLDLIINLGCVGGYGRVQRASVSKDGVDSVFAIKTCNKVDAYAFQTLLQERNMYRYAPHLYIAPGNCLTCCPGLLVAVVMS